MPEEIVDGAAHPHREPVGSAVEGRMVVSLQAVILDDVEVASRCRRQGGIHSIETVDRDTADPCAAGPLGRDPVLWRRPHGCDQRTAPGHAVCRSRCRPVVFRRWRATFTSFVATRVDALSSILTIQGLTKRYAAGSAALEDVDLEIRRGEIFGLLGPNGAGKTTLISIVCGLVNATAGHVAVDGHDIVRDFRRARAEVGLVPQELVTDAFETVANTVRFSRGLFGLADDAAHLERVLRELSLWDKRNAQVRTLSGGMKRRLLIAKALAHEPRLLFLDEPTAGVDVELRRDMWTMIRRLRAEGMTIVLTTHYLEEAEAMADRIGVINKGRLILVENKATVLERFGQRRLKLELAAPLASVPEALAGLDLALADEGRALVRTLSSEAGEASVAEVLRRVLEAGLDFEGVSTSESSLEDIFVELVSERP